MNNKPCINYIVFVSVVDETLLAEFAIPHAVSDDLSNNLVILIVRLH